MRRASHSLSQAADISATVIRRQYREKSRTLDGPSSMTMLLTPFSPRLWIRPRPPLPRTTGMDACRAQNLSIICSRKWIFIAAFSKANPGLLAIGTV
jgi:hypothetical protein